MNERRTTWRTNGVLMPFHGEVTRVQLRVDSEHVEDLGDDFYRYEETLLFEPAPIVVDEIVWCSLPWSRSQVWSADVLELVVDRLARDPNSRMQKHWREELVGMEGYVGWDSLYWREMERRREVKK